MWWKFIRLTWKWVRNALKCHPFQLVHLKQHSLRHLPYPQNLNKTVLTDHEKMSMDLYIYWIEKIAIVRKPTETGINLFHSCWHLWTKAKVIFCLVPIPLEIWNPLFNRCIRRWVFDTYLYPVFMNFSGSHTFLLQSFDEWLSQCLVHV